MTLEVLFGYMQDFSPFSFGFRDYLLSLHLNYHFPKIMLLQKNIVKKYLALLNKEQTLAAFCQGARLYVESVAKRDTFQKRIYDE